MRQRERESAAPGRPTQTITETPAEETAGGTLRLQGEHSHSRRVVWAEDTIDNEKLGRKSSKICCIYHKPKKFDESSSEESSSSSDSDDTGDEHDLAATRDLKMASKQKKKKRKLSSEQAKGKQKLSNLSDEQGGAGEDGVHESCRGHEHAAVHEEVNEKSENSMDTPPPREPRAHNAYEKGIH